MGRLVRIKQTKTIEEEITIWIKDGCESLEANLIVGKNPIECIGKENIAYSEVGVGIFISKPILKEILDSRQTNKVKQGELFE